MDRQPDVEDDLRDLAMPLLPSRETQEEREERGREREREESGCLDTLGSTTSTVLTDVAM